MIRKSFFWCALLLLAANRIAWTQEAAPQNGHANLLVEQGVTVQHTTMAGELKTRLALLSDGRSETVATLPASSEVPIDIVYGFADKTVTPHQLSVEFGPASKQGEIAKVDVLVSSLAPNSGFQSLTEAVLKAGARPQVVSLPQAAAKWLMVRITASKDVDELAIAELRVFGHLGAPRSRYAFNESPAKALQVLAKLQDQVQSAISDDERVLMADARDGKLDEHSFAEAALIASGVSDTSARNRYLKKIDEYEAAVRKATTNLASPFEKGRAILKWIHQHPMSAGYLFPQTDLSTIVDTGKFNCVSSATLYNILSRRLGIDARAIEVPDHAFSIVYHGANHVDVETTTPYGFDPQSNERARKQFEERTGFSYVDEKKKDLRREIDELGLVGVIYYNHGVTHSKKEQYLEALVDYFRALSLDPEFDSSVKNSLAALANWGILLSEDGNFEKAVQVIDVGLALAPQDATLLNNRKATWTQWISATVKDGNTAEALALVRHAHQAVPDGKFLAMQSWVFIGPGEEKVKAKQWPAALALAETSLKQSLEESALKELRDWRRSVISRWWDAEQSAGRFTQAALVLERGLKIEPNDKRFAHNLGFLVQEWLKKTQADEGTEQAQTIMSACLKRFPNIAQVQQASVNHLYLRMKALREGAKHADAIATAELAIKLLPNNKDVAQWPQASYAFWASSLIDQEKWLEARKVYVQARGRFPKDKRFADAEESLIHRWAKKPMDAKDWQTALDIYEKGLARLPDSKRVQQQIVYLAQQLALAKLESDGGAAAEMTIAKVIEQHPQLSRLTDVATALVQHQISQLEKAKKYDEALAVVDRAAVNVKQAKEIPDLAKYVLSRQLTALAEAKDWQPAVAVGIKGLQRFPKDGTFVNNTKYCYSMWARGHFEKEEWKQAQVVLEAALKQFPNDGGFKRNLDLCKHQQKNS